MEVNHGASIRGLAQVLDHLFSFLHKHITRVLAERLDVHDMRRQPPLHLPLVPVHIEDTVAEQVAHGAVKDGALLVRPKVGLEHVFHHLGGVALDHAANNRQRDGPHGAELLVLLDKEVVEFGARDREHQGHVAQQGDGPAGLLQLASGTGANGVGAVLEQEQGHDSGHNLGVVGFGPVLEEGGEEVG